MEREINGRILAEMYDDETKIPTPTDYRTRIPDIIGDSVFISEKKFMCFMKLWSNRGFSLEYDGRRDPVVCRRMDDEEKNESAYGIPGGLYDGNSVMRFSSYSMRGNKLRNDIELYRRMGFLIGNSGVDEPEDGYCEVINAVTMKYFSDHKRICFDDTTKEIHLYNDGTILLLDIDNNSDAVFLLRDGFTGHRDKYLSALYELHGEDAPEIDFSSRLTDLQDNIGDEGGDLRISYDVISCSEEVDRTVVDLKLYIPKEDSELSEFLGVRLVKNNCDE